MLDGKSQVALREGFAREILEAVDRTHRKYSSGLERTNEQKGKPTGGACKK
ncbi:hypothetical protein PI125_g18934 [Phytophthora idaei]|nr:hypothetical protein PI125_g18934 [Phytophthora idaei]